ncbi:hypothetical protein [Streptomyces sp. NPDC050704]|uniref:hypothetical protein n=1 Tax=Streptomyces sp. NPDC050704 TaxID=3157219 RepID=UPI0034365F45
MITVIQHTATETGPAGLDLALKVAHELHAPAPRAPEVAAAAPRTAAVRRSAGRRRPVRG